MIINYILVAVITSGGWSNMTITKPHTFAADCYAEGQAWKEAHIRQRLANNQMPAITWTCKRVAP